MDQGKKILFEEVPVPQAIMKLAVPTVISQIILVIYNMADTFFIGMTGSDAMLTAVTVCMPAFMFLSAISNLFGIGGGAVISRSLGRKDVNRAENASAFALYGCLITTCLYCLSAYLMKDSFIAMLGGVHPDVHAYAAEYLTVTVVFGGLFTAVNTMFAHLIRAEGRSLHAGIGIAMGGILNVILDPLFMFVILPEGKEALGAALATALSNVISCIYFTALILLSRKRHTVLAFRFHQDAFRDGSARELLLNGLPACLMTLFENISYAVMDHLMAYGGMEAQAGLGVAKKVNMLAHCIVRGMSQGVMPLIAYSYASDNYRRMKEVIRTSAGMSVLISCVIMGICLIFSPWLIGLFIRSGSASAYYGTHFLRVLCLGCPFSAFAYAVISFFQAIGQNRRSFRLAVLRKGAMDIPLMCVMHLVSPVIGIVAATPVTDVICCGAATVLLVHMQSDLMNDNEKVKLKESF